jgi:DNA primase
MTSDEIKAMHTMREIVEKYGVFVNKQGFGHCPFHTGDNTPSLKVYKDNYHCHACGADGDIFTWVMDMDNLTFREAFIQLGGKYEQSFSARFRRDQATKEREKQLKEEKRQQLIVTLNLNLITAYRNRISVTEPYSEEWCYCQNELVKQIAQYEYLNEKR